MASIADPRLFPLSEPPRDAPVSEWHALVETALAASTGDVASAAAAELHAVLLDALVARDVHRIEQALDAAPSPVVHRHLLRALQSAWADPHLDADREIVAHGFAIPIVIVAAADCAIDVPGVIDSVTALADLLREHRALAGNRTFGLANVLAGREAVGLPSLAAWLERRQAAMIADEWRNVAPASIGVAAGREGAHLRFIVGSALAASGAQLLREDSVRRWGMPLATALSRQLAGQAGRSPYDAALRASSAPGAAGLQLLALPRSPADPLLALQRGQLAHREVALQLFAGNALRTLRARHGEPTAVLSAHRIGRDGEVRLSLSSVFGERDAEGFRCPLLPFERVDDAVKTIVDLLAECRVADIRIVRDIHDDRDRTTGAPVFFRADSPEVTRSGGLH